MSRKIILKDLSDNYDPKDENYAPEWFLDFKIYEKAGALIFDYINYHNEHVPEVNTIFLKFEDEKLYAFLDFLKMCKGIDSEASGVKYLEINQVLPCYIYLNDGKPLKKKTRVSIKYFAVDKRLMIEPVEKFNQKIDIPAGFLYCIKDFDFITKHFEVLQILGGG